MKPKEALKKFWYLLWKDDSLKGWIFSIIFLFIFIKFIFFPLLSLTLGFSFTDIKNSNALPLAIVESCSMYHQGNMLSNFDLWWDRQEEKYSSFDIEKEDFIDFQMKKGFNKGDILLIVKAKPEKLKEGDIIIFNANQQNPIIHRIVEIKETSNGRIFSTMGDNNPGQANFEREIRESQLVGKSVFKIAPYAGWIKLVFFEWQKPDAEKGFCTER